MPKTTLELAKPLAAKRSKISWARSRVMESP